MMENKKRGWAALVSVLLAMAVLVLYARTLSCYFVWDDLMYLEGFSQYQGGAGAVRAVAEPFFLYPSYYRPLVMLSFVMSAEPAVQHGINVLLHALNTVLVFWCARALMPREAAVSRAGILAAALGALLFAVHPVAVETVAWVSGRFDTLMCFFVLSICFVVLGGKLTRRRLVLVFVLFFAAMCSKESAIGLPVALPLLLLLKWRLTGEEFGLREMIRRLVPLLAVLALGAALYVAMRLAVIQRLFAGEDAGITFAGDSGVLGRLNVAALAVTEFVKLVVNPWSHSAPQHPFKYEASGGLLVNTLVVSGCVLALLAAVFLKKPRLNFPLALLTALAMLWPALHLIGIPVSGGNIISDRYALAPLALLLALLAAIAGAWLARRVPAMGASEMRALGYAGVLGLLWAGALAAHTNVTIPMWCNEYVLWAFAHRQVPESALAHEIYIKTLMTQELWDEANSEFNQFFRERHESLSSLSEVFVVNWMVTRAKTGDYQGALELFELAEKMLVSAGRVADEDVRSAGILYRSRGIIESDIGNWQQALHWHEKSVLVSPTDVRSAFRYAQALFMNGQSEKADEMFTRALAGSTRELADWALEWRKGWRLPEDEGGYGVTQGSGEVK